MNEEKQKRLEKVGFKVGSVQDFLELTNEEVVRIPNRKTRQVIEDSRKGVNVNEYDNVDDLY
ncbi:MAG: hypothetical protein WCK49_03590 [Myxococcaceae bacterium]